MPADCSTGTTAMIGGHGGFHEEAIVTASQGRLDHQVPGLVVGTVVATAIVAGVAAAIVVLVVGAIVA